jgi:hypothetical protein
MPLSLRQLFALLVLSFVTFLCAGSLFAWTAPTATAPNNNPLPPINESGADQVKNAGLAVNALAVFGVAYVQSDLMIATTSSANAVNIAGTLRIGNGGEVCQAVTAGTLRYNSSSKLIEYCNGTSWRPL